MVDINIIDDTIFIKNINKDSIKNIYSIYRNTGDFKYATGVFNSIEYDQFSHQISQFLLRPNVFFLDIYLVSSGELIGLVKGTLIDRNKIVWINSLVINTQFQSKGYGKKVVELLENYLKRKCDVEKNYLSVYKSNFSGINFWNKCGYTKCNSFSQRNLNKFNDYVQFMWKIL
ncbi:MAG TPA: GNAT family N-acetyltransferase [Ruminiclostridium sp.]